MNSTLSFEYQFSADGDDFGSLIAEVKTPDFHGRNGMWVQWQDLAKFAASLSQFPIEAGNPLQCGWGFSENNEYTGVTALSIGPMRENGGLVANVNLANYYSPDMRCQTRFEVDYPSLGRFRFAIEQMMRDKSGVAILEGMTYDFR